MDKFKGDCGCNTKKKCEEPKQCGCIVNISTDCVKWEGDETFDQNEELTVILKNLRDELDKIKIEVDLIPKTIIQEFLLRSETVFQTKYKFIPSSVKVYIDGRPYSLFTTRNLDEVIINTRGLGEVITIEYKTVDDVQ